MSPAARMAVPRISAEKNPAAPTTAALRTSFWPSALAMYMALPCPKKKARD